MRIEKTKLDGVMIIEPDVFPDERGWFLETFQEERYREILGLSSDEHFVQDNLNYSKKGVVRGLHFQAPPMAQGKLVSVLSGRALDVALDIRFGSPTFGQHIMVELTADNHRQLYITRGFAHGFVVLENKTLFSYKCTNLYSCEHERGILWNDPALGIAWNVKKPLLSEKDQAYPLFNTLAREFTYNG